MSDETPDIPAEGSWRASVEQFEAEAAWLTGADKPQLKALYSIADALDGGTFQAALISQFTLIHRGLLARQASGKGAAGGGEREPDLLDMLAQNPGAVPVDLWRADQ